MAVINPKNIFVEPICNDSWLIYTNPRHCGARSQLPLSILILPEGANLRAFQRNALEYRWTLRFLDQEGTLLTHRVSYDQRARVVREATKLTKLARFGSLLQFACNRGFENRLVALFSPDLEQDKPPNRTGKVPFDDSNPFIEFKLSFETPSSVSFDSIVRFVRPILGQKRVREDESDDERDRTRQRIDPCATAAATGGGESASTTSTSTSTSSSSYDKDSFDLFSLLSENPDADGTDFTSTSSSSSYEEQSLSLVSHDSDVASQLVPNCTATSSASLSQVDTCDDATTSTSSVMYETSSATSTSTSTSSSSSYGEQSLSSVSDNGASLSQVDTFDFTSTSSLIFGSFPILPFDETTEDSILFSELVLDEHDCIWPLEILFEEHSAPNPDPN